MAVPDALGGDSRGVSFDRSRFGEGLVASLALVRRAAASPRASVAALRALR
jgi:hypothetical protein